jgi:HK97 family phage major capsid protein
MDKITLLKQLIEKEENAEQLKALQDELIEAIAEREREKLESEYGEKVAALSEELEKAKHPAKVLEPAADGRIEVGLGDRYKGYQVKHEIAMVKDHEDLPDGVKARFARDERTAEKMTRFFIDLYTNATKMPVGEAREKGMTEGTVGNGGYLTPQEQRTELYAYVRESSIALQDCMHVPMSSDSLLLNSENGKASVAFTDEATDATETTPTISQTTLTAKRLDGYTKVTNELLGDADVNGGIVGMLMSQFVEAVGLKIDSAVFTGTGDPVSGVFLSAGYSETFDTGSTHFSEILESNLRAIIGKIQPERLTNARWYVNHSPKWNYLYGLKDGDDRPLFIPALTESSVERLYGWPVRSGSKMPSTSAAETGWIVFGDLKGFVIGDRLTNISLFVDPYSLSRSYQTQFLLFTRWAFAHLLSNNYGRIVTGASS